MILASDEMIRKWTELDAWGHKTLIDCFESHVRKEPDKICLVDPLNKEALVGNPPERLTYRELARATDATAKGLVERGIGKDNIVLVQLPNCWELAMLYLAICRAGALISPVPMQWRTAELAYIARLTGAEAFITIEKFRGFEHKRMVEQLRIQCPDLKRIISLSEVREISKQTPSAHLPSLFTDPNHAFTLCWSSGTEAEPKGCPLSHNNWICQASLKYEATPMEPGDSFITAGPLVNMASVGTVFVPWLMGGGKLVLNHPFDGELFIRQLTEEQINFTLLVPAVVNALLRHPKVDTFDLSQMKAICIGGAAPSLWSIRELKKRWNVEFVNTWGQNEGPAINAGPFDIPNLEMRVDHLPFPGKASGKKWAAPVRKFLDLKIMDPLTEKEMTRVGDIGELYYRGPNVIPCYFGRPDLTAKAFDPEGFFKTGDLFQIKENHCMGFFERCKDIIIRGGFNISARQVEDMLLGHPKVLDVAAVAMPDERLGEKNCIYAVPAAGETIGLEELTSFLKDKGIAMYKLPERLEIIGEIPRNAVGKILKKDLRKDILIKLMAEGKMK